MLAHLRTDVHGPRIRPPGPAQKNLLRRGISNKLTIQKNKPKRLTGGRRRSGDIRIDKTADNTMTEHRRRLSKNKISGAFYITVVIILPAALGARIQRILVAQQPATGNDTTTPLHMQGHSLPDPASRIPDGQILRGKIIPLHQN